MSPETPKIIAVVTDPGFIRAGERLLLRQKAETYQVTKITLFGRIKKALNILINSDA